MTQGEAAAMAPGRLLPLCLLLLLPAAAASEAQPGPSGSPLPDLCRAPRVTGPCRAAFPRWFYSAENGTCQPFTYGGCRGNRNNFPSRQDCLSRCSPPAEQAAGPTVEFLSSTALALGVLLAVLAALLLGYAADLTLRSCRGRAELSAGPAAAWGPADDKEYLMSNAYTL